MPANCQRQRCRKRASRFCSNASTISHKVLSTNVAPAIMQRPRKALRTGEVVAPRGRTASAPIVQGRPRKEAAGPSAERGLPHGVRQSSPMAANLDASNGRSPILLPFVTGPTGLVDLSRQRQGSQHLGLDGR